MDIDRSEPINSKEVPNFGVKLKPPKPKKNVGSTATEKSLEMKLTKSRDPTHSANIKKTKLNLKPVKNIQSHNSSNIKAQSQEVLQTDSSTGDSIELKKTIL